MAYVFTPEEELILDQLAIHEDGTLKTATVALA